MKNVTIKLIFAALFSLFSFLFVTGTQAQAPTPRLWVSSDVQQVSAGQQFTVTINVGDAVGVYGGSFKLNYDAQALQLVLTTDSKAVTPGAFFGNQASFTLSNKDNAGVIDYALTLTQPSVPVDGGGVLGTITFLALQDTTVDLTPSEARLLSPEFTEVDGRMVARKINEVATQIEGLTVTVGAGSTIAEPAVVATVAVPTTAPIVATQVVPQPSVTVPASQPSALPVNPILLIGALLFLLGLGLFTASVGFYVKMRRQYTHVEQESVLEAILW